MPANFWSSKYWTFRIRNWSRVRTQVSRWIFLKYKMCDFCHLVTEITHLLCRPPKVLLRRPTVPQQPRSHSIFSLALNVFLARCFWVPHSSALPLLFPPFPQSASHAKCRPLQTAKGGEERRQSLFSPLSCILHAHRSWRAWACLCLCPTVTQRAQVKGQTTTIRSKGCKTRYSIWDK